MSIVTSSTRNLNKLTKKYLSGREPKCVHRTLLLRTLIMLKEMHPETEKIFAPVVKTFMSYSKRPDKKGDYENGMGRHYYCAVNVSGRELPVVNGYFRNGSGKFPKSARTMFEEDYTMALVMYRAGYIEKSAEFLGRAVHMLSDMCCIPHTSSMTYFSSGRNFHKAYENVAELIYPALVPEQHFPELPDFFDSRSSFADDINKIALETAKGIRAVKESPQEAVKQHLLRTERILAKFLLRFLEDSVSHERSAHYITNNSGCRLLKGTSRLAVKITESGIEFHGVNPSPISGINVTATPFYIAHRHNGLFTLSPVMDNSGLVLEVIDGKFFWRKFNPTHSGQLFRL
ncbi:MAG: hypothetical protein NC340_04245 [Ruminococcus flavefaciens]|nr:hypothetical protein [Ruminococcus flavefaciens]MCM1229263.1 hypothetical protein [Ruminococcus flavefaciens]